MPEGNSDAPAHAPLVLAALVLAATVANLNLAVANVALPDIGMAFNASQTGLNMVAVGYSLGLAGSVLYLGAIGDRYGRKKMLLGGIALSIPACIAAAWAPSVEFLILARIVGGLSAGMAFPTTLALITALWRGPARTKSIALWSAVGGATASLGPLVAGWLLGWAWWGSVFLVTLPLAVITLVLVVRLIPAHVNETTDKVDNIGGVVSIFAVAALIMGITFAPEPGRGTAALVLLGLATLLIVAFVIRQRRAANPLYDLDIAARPVFWVAAVGGIIVFGALMGAMFVGQQYLQNVLGYSTLAAGASMIPAAVIMILVAPQSAKLVEAKGSRFTLLAGYAACFAGFIVMLAFWRIDAGYLSVGAAFVLIGAGVGLAGTPASHSLTSSVPVSRAGMASGTADLQRDLGGAILQSVFGALLTLGYSTRFAKDIAASPEATTISEATETQLLRSFSSAEEIAKQYPQYASQITSAARDAFVHGQFWAYLVGAASIAAGAALVAWKYPAHDRERELIAGYAAADNDAASS